MKFLISHRGNTHGPEPLYENTVGHIEAALSGGFDVEVDVWFGAEKWWLGHDEPLYRVDFSFLTNCKLWLRCKNQLAYDQLNDNLYLLSREQTPHFFMHDGVITSSGFDWVYPGKEIDEISVAVMPEKVHDWDISRAIGVCSDFVAKYK